VSCNCTTKFIILQFSAKCLSAKCLSAKCLSARCHST